MYDKSNQDFKEWPFLAGVVVPRCHEDWEELLGWDRGHHISLMSHANHSRADIVALIHLLSPVYCNAVVTLKAEQPASGQLLGHCDTGCAFSKTG